MSAAHRSILSPQHDGSTRVEGEAGASEAASPQADDRRLDPLEQLLRHTRAVSAAAAGRHSGSHEP